MFYSDYEDYLALIETARAGCVVERELSSNWWAKAQEATDKGQLCYAQHLKGLGEQAFSMEQEHRDNVLVLGMALEEWDAQYPTGRSAGSAVGADHTYCP